MQLVFIALLFTFSIEDQLEEDADDPPRVIEAAEVVGIDEVDAERVVVLDTVTVVAM